MEPGAGEATLADAIARYLQAQVGGGRSKVQMLETTLHYPIAEMACSTIGRAEILQHARILSDRAQPQTVAAYLWTLKSVFAIADDAWGFRLRESEFEVAMTVARHRGLVSTGNKRTRRPSLDEMNRLMEFFDTTGMPTRRVLPMQEIIAFAVFSTRRLGEIVNLKWTDYEGDRIMIRARGGAATWGDVGVRLNLPHPCPAIIEAMPKSGPLIFPANARSVSAAFQRACKALHIDDLHFHDLRHEAVSRLLEMNWHPHQVQSVSGHKTLDNLQRYAHFEASGDKLAGWHWLERITGRTLADIPSTEAMDLPDGWRMQSYWQTRWHGRRG